MSGYTWGQAELEALKKLWPLYLAHKLEREDITAVLTSRTWDAIASKVETLGLSPGRNGIIDNERLKNIMKAYKL